MKCLLITKELWGAIEDSEHASAATDKLALGLIGLYLSPINMGTWDRCSKAKECWEVLEGIYKANSVASRLQMRKELNSFQQQPEEPITDYVARAQTLRDHLLAAGEEVKDEQLAMTVLTGLPANYDIVATVLETTSSKLDVTSILPHLLTVESKIKPRRVMADAALYSAHSAHRTHSQPAPDTGIAYSQGWQPTLSSGVAGNSIFQEVECFYCKRKGHIKKDCRKKKRDASARASAGRGRPAPTRSLDRPFTDQTNPRINIAI